MLTDSTEPYVRYNEYWAILLGKVPRAPMNRERLSGGTRC